MIYVNEIGTEMAVFNVKVKYIRPVYDDLRAWMEDPNNVYIGRRGIVFIDNKRFPSEDSIWANPYKIGPNCTREEVIVNMRLISERNFRIPIL